MRARRELRRGTGTGPVAVDVAAFFAGSFLLGFVIGSAIGWSCYLYCADRRRR